MRLIDFIYLAGGIASLVLTLLVALLLAAAAGYALGSAIERGIRAYVEGYQPLEPTQPADGRTIGFVPDAEYQEFARKA